MNCFMSSQRSRDETSERKTQFYFIRQGFKPRLQPGQADGCCFMDKNVNNVPTFYERGLTGIFIIGNQAPVHRTTSVNHKFGWNNKKWVKCQRRNLKKKKNEFIFKKLCYFVKYLASSQDKNFWAFLNVLLFF